MVKMTFGFGRKRDFVLLIGLFVFSLVPRIMGTNFGLPDFHFHTDEPLLVQPIVKNLATFNFRPDSFIYPPFHQYFQVLMLLPLHLAEKVLNIFFSMITQETYLASIYWFARMDVALISSFSALLVYYLGKTVFNKRIGIISSLVYSASFISIFLSHYVKNETLLTFWGIAVMLCTVLAIKNDERTKRWLSLGAFFAGIGLMTHYNGFLFLLLPVGATLFIKTSFKQKIMNIFICLLFFFLGAFLASPDNFFEFPKAATQIWNTFTDLKIYAVHMTDQNGFPNWLWYLTYLLTSGLWYPIFFAFCGGYLLSLFTKKKEHVFLGLFSLIFFVFFSLSPQRTDRYLLPLSGFWAIYCGFFINWIIDKVNRRRLIQLFIILIFILIPYFRGVVFSYEIIQKDTRQLAGEWIIENYPKGKTIFLVGDATHIGHYLQSKGYDNIINLFPLDKQDFYFYPGELIIIDSVDYHNAKNYYQLQPYRSFFDNYLLIKNQSLLVKEFVNPLFKAEFFSPSFLEHASTVNAYHNPSVEIYQIPKIPAIYDFKYEYIYLPEKMTGNGTLVDQNGTKFISSNGQPLIVSGPHQLFPLGEYKLTYFLKNVRCPELKTNFTIKITSSGGARTLLEKEFSCRTLAAANLEVKVTLLSAQRLELLLQSPGGIDFLVEKALFKRKNVL